jgi:hypothetical protein
MTTVELDIENKIVEYLQEEITDIDIEAYNSDIISVYNKAKECRNGLVVVSTENGSDPNVISNNAVRGEPIYEIGVLAVVTILTHDRRNREGNAVFYNQIRDLLHTFTYNTYRGIFKYFEYKPIRLYDIEEGLWKSDIVIEFILNYPFDYLFEEET